MILELTPDEVSQLTGAVWDNSVRWERIQPEYAEKLIALHDRLVDMYNDKEDSWLRRRLVEMTGKIGTYGMTLEDNEGRQQYIDVELSKMLGGKVTLYVVSEEQ